MVPSRLILCVDDEVVGLRVRRALLEHAGYTVLTAHNGIEALTLFEDQPIEAVVLDYFMPGMHGPEVAARMRQLKPRVPILLLSANLGLLEESAPLVDRCMIKGAGVPLFSTTSAASSPPRPERAPNLALKIEGAAVVRQPLPSCSPTITAAAGPRAESPPRARTPPD
jgi:CheY-like chemotaxis protein